MHIKINGDVEFNIGELVDELTDPDPYEGGQLEQLETKVENLSCMLARLVYVVFTTPCDPKDVLDILDESDLSDALRHRLWLRDGKYDLDDLVVNKVEFL